MAVVIGALAGAGPAWACATCGCTLSKDWLGGQGMGSAGWSIGLSYDFIDQNQLRVGTTKLSLAQADAILNTGPNAPSGNEVETQTLTRTTTLNLDYNTPEWGVSVQLPMVYRYHTTNQNGIYPNDTSNAQSYNFSQVDSLGDLRIVGRYAVLADSTAGVTVGVKLPTGQTNAQFAGYGGNTGDYVDPSLQAGTGSTDLLLGGYYTGQVEDFGWFAQALWQHALSSQAGYTPGDAITANVGLRYAAMGQTVVPLLQLNVVHRNTDSGFNASREADGTPQTGGNLVYLAPGVSATLGNGFRAYGYVQIPIYQNVNGVQLVAKEIVSVGIRKSF